MSSPAVFASPALLLAVSPSRRRWLGAVALLAAACAHPSITLAAGAGSADVSLSGVWVRATVAGQPVAAAYGRITGNRDLKLVAVASPIAKRAEVHEMQAGGGDMMQMRAVPSVPLPKGRTVTLAPGGLHVMLFEIAKPLAVGTTVPLVFTFERGKGDRFTQTVDAPVRTGDGAAQGGGASRPVDPVGNLH